MGSRHFRVDTNKLKDLGRGLRAFCVAKVILDRNRGNIDIAVREISDTYTSRYAEQKVLGLLQVLAKDQAFGRRCGARR